MLKNSQRPYYSPTMSSSRKNDESTPNRMAMRVLLENMILRNPLGFFVFTPAAQQESNEGTVQEVMLNRVLFERDVWRCTGSGNRIPSCNSVWRGRDDEIWRVAVAMALAKSAHGLWGETSSYLRKNSLKGRARYSDDYALRVAN
jgi:hypothetical protein